MIHVTHVTHVTRVTTAPQVEDRLRQLLADHAAALTAEQERGRLLEARLAAALTDREDSVARLQKTVRRISNSLLKLAVGPMHICHLCQACGTCHICHSCHTCHVCHIRHTWHNCHTCHACHDSRRTDTPSHSNSLPTAAQPPGGDGVPAGGAAGAAVGAGGRAAAAAGGHRCQGGPAPRAPRRLSPTPDAAAGRLPWWVALWVAFVLGCVSSVFPQNVEFKCSSNTFYVFNLKNFEINALMVWCSVRKFCVMTDQVVR